MVLWGEGKDRLWYFGEKGRAALQCFGREVPPHVLYFVWFLSLLIAYN